MLFGATCISDFGTSCVDICDSRALMLEGQQAQQVHLRWSRQFVASLRMGQIYKNTILYYIIFHYIILYYIILYYIILYIYCIYIYIYGWGPRFSDR